MWKNSKSLHPNVHGGGERDTHCTFILYPQHVSQELMRALRMRVRNWCVHWAYTSGTDGCTEHTRQVSAQSQCLRPQCWALSILVRNWCICWAYASVPVAYPWAYASVSYAYDQHKRKNSKFEKVPLKNTDHVRKELMGALSMRVRNWCMNWAYTSEIIWCLAPQKIKVKSIYFSPKVTNPERLYGLKIMKIWAIKNLTFGHL